MSTPAVELRGVGKRFQRHADRRSTLKERIVRGRSKQTQDFWAVRDISLAIPRGSVYGIIGHNGSGKSTLLKLMTGIYRPTEGSIATEGQQIVALGAMDDWTFDDLAQLIRKVEFPPAFRNGGLRTRRIPRDR